MEEILLCNFLVGTLLLGIGSLVVCYIGKLLIDTFLKKDVLIKDSIKWETLNGKIMTINNDRIEKVWKWAK